MKKVTNLIFILILIAQCLYSAVFIYQTSFVDEGQRYFVLFDDAMISMRYAQNLAQGEGLVWNPGERVEGYTNLLWVLFMALVHLLPIPAPYMSLPIQISGALFYLVSLVILKKIAYSLSQNSGTVLPGVVMLAAVFISGFYIQINVWNLLGMETSAAILVTNLAVWMAIRYLQTPPENRRLPVKLYLLLGLSTLLRLDMLVIGLAIVSFLAAADGWDHWQKEGSRPALQHAGKHLAAGLGIVAVFLLAQTAWRWWYYGELLPNTYYLKITGAPKALLIKRGLYVYYKFLWNFSMILFLLPLVMIALRRDRKMLLLGWVFLAMSAYSIYVGGDAWEHRGGANRFISVVLPLFFVLFAYSLEAIRSALLTWNFRGRQDQQSALQPSRRVQRVSILVLCGFVFLSLLNFNTVQDMRSLDYALLQERHPFIAGSERYVFIANLVEYISTPSARVAVVTAGIIPYYSQRPVIDLLGKNDKVIARQPMRIEPGLDLLDLRPGHMKWDSAYSIGQLQPDIVAQLYDGYNNPENLQYLTNYTRLVVDDIPVFLRNDSPYVLWDQVQALAGE